ncbi:MAG: FecR domain-containing protein [Verrucomicrobium sp.]|nr:FecR domain-containing protein [Verrucomicrobium sp.]
MAMRILCLGAALFFPLFSLQAAPVEAVVKAVQGRVEACPAGGTFAPLKAGARLSSGTRIRTDGSGRAILLVTPGAAACLEKGTSVRLEHLEFSRTADGVARRKALLNLRSGTVLSLIDRKNPNVTDFVVRTPQGADAVPGAFYRVTVRGGKTHVRTTAGQADAAARAELKKAIKS